MTDIGGPRLVHRTRIADTETAVSAALKLMQPGRGDFVLESVEAGETRGRYSLIGLAPDLLFRVQDGVAACNRRWLQDPDAFEALSDPPVAALRALVGECRLPVPDGLPPALSLLVGYFGYETLTMVETVARAPGDPLRLPDMLFVRPTLLLVFDRLADTLTFVAPLWTGGDEGEALARIDDAEARLNGPVPAGAPVTAALPDVEPEATLPPAQYGAMVDAAREYIEAGDIFQVVLAQRFTAPFPLPPIALYRALRRINPSPFLFFLDLPGFALIGSSPEILVRARDGEVTIRPIAGTRPRGRTARDDDAAAESLLADPKERAEHLMLLDLGRNDVGRVAEAGSVRVTADHLVERYSHVMHIVSNVSGRLRVDRDALDALFAGFPAGTVSGAPKLRACQIVAALEPEVRGPYAGGVGYFAPDGGMDSCIVLRTAIVKDGVMHVRAGAGIVADSDPAYEARECAAKAGALFAAAREAVRLAGR
ncbi:anthranilate synthase component 1 [Sphingomonas jejuensis]|uniref:Anthranilate synthase component 1 n=1 Tax=Sphingomonas jejuensis TaxID=904715 RepID=A0ABX0XKB8_9SPHN|nr:anthranilate synthase component 1 [Sphingomonas jejuensis]